MCFFYATAICTFTQTPYFLRLMADCEPGVLHLDDSDVDELRPAVGEESSRQEVHLLLGDSIPYRMGERLDVSPPDILLNFSSPGNTWARLATDQARQVAEWQEAARAFGCTLRTCIVWMSGNDVYPRTPGDLSHVVRLGDFKENVDEVLSFIWAAARNILVLGPLPRYRHDAGKCWVNCPAFAAQQAAKRVCDQYLGVEFLPLGRTFTKNYKRWHLVGEDSRQFFTSDGVHLSAAGEEAVLQRVPQWLQWHE